MKSNIRPPALIMMILTLAMVTAFQACTQEKFSSSSNARPGAPRGNGDFYQGKGTYFLFADEHVPCTQKTASGKAFPNSEIFVMNGDFKLVRDECKEIEPVAVLDVTVAADGSSLTHRQKTFHVEYDMSDYLTVPPLCPSGKSLLQSNPINLFSDSVQLSSQNWNNHSEIGRILAGAISAMPLFQIVRTNSTSLTYWMRASQSVQLSQSRTYALSALLKSGNVDQALIMYYGGNNSEFDIEANITSGQTNVFYNTTGSVSVVSQPFAGGRSFTTFFTTNGNPSNADIGFSTYRSPPSAIQTGDYIFATGASLYDVSSYCSP